MKEIVEFLASKKIVCRRLKAIATKELGRRKRVGIYLGVALDDYYCTIMVLKKKSRVLRKEAKELEELHNRLCEKIGAAIKRKYLLMDAPLCSKAAASLEEWGWKIYRLS